MGFTVLGLNITVWVKHSHFKVLGKPDEIDLRGVSLSSVRMFILFMSGDRKRFFLGLGIRRSINHPPLSVCRLTRRSPEIRDPKKDISISIL